MSPPRADSGHSFDEVDSEEPLTKLPATLSTLLTTNDPPTNLQTSQISAVEFKLLSDLVDVKNKINEYEDMLEDLRALRAKQRRLLKTCKGIRSLIRCLPDELLSRIFFECIPEDGVTVSQTSTHEAPMVLCQICSRWRAIAIATPQLWNRLTTTIGPELPEPSYSEDVVELMLEWFDRAKTLPLFLRFTSRLPYFAPQQPTRVKKEAHVPYVLLHPLTARLRFLDLAVGWTPFYLGSLPAECRFPRLESLILRKMGFWQEESWFSWPREEPLMTFRDATRLRRVAMHYPIFGNNIGNVLFPWKQLTHLIISEKIQHSVLEDLLRNCVNLQQGVFHLTDIPHSVPLREVKTIQHHLVDLTITMYISFNPGILRNFELPALQSLRMGPLSILDEQWDDRDLLYPHLSSIRRLSFQADYIYIRNKTLSCDRIVDLLRQAANVERLDLCPGIFYPDLMEALTVDASALIADASAVTVNVNAPAPSVTTSPTSILPRLRSLSVDLGVTPLDLEWFLERLESRDHPRRFSALALGKMVKSRWLSGCLEELHIYLGKEDGDISDQIQDALEECLNEGFVEEEYSAETLRHWSTRLEDEEVTWPEGLSVLVSEGM